MRSRTQQVIAHETGVVNTADPLGGSYFVESLTSELERQAYEYFERIDALGGVVAAIEQNFFQREIAEASFRYQREVERGERVVVGVNRYVTDDEAPPLLRIDPALESAQIERVRALRGAARRRRGPGCVDSSEDGRGAGGSQPDACDRRRLAGLRDDGGDVRRAQGGVGRLAGDAGLLSSRKIRVVIAKPGLDGHDRGAKVIARALRDAGMEVIYTGLHQTPEQIVETAIQEDADAVGISILSGAHMTLVPRIIDLLRDRGADDVLVVVGGTIPADDVAELKERGVAEVFGPGATTSDIVDFLQARAA